VFGEVASELGETARVAIGPFEFERISVALAPNGFFNQGFPADSILGYDLHSQFQIRIDYPRQRLWLRRRSSQSVHFLGVHCQGTGSGISSEG
jgi:hypothetical protein